MARLIVKDGSSERVIELVDAITIVGRSSDNKVFIDDKQASRKHCHFEKTDHGYKLVDLESRNGTRVNGKIVNQSLLRPSDRVEIGKHVIVYEDAAFKEPPAEVAALFAPAAAGPALSPVASAPAPSETSPSSAPQGPRTQRRSATGHTTAIERIATAEVAREKQLLTRVGVIAGVFLILVIALIVVNPGGGGPPAVPARPGTAPMTDVRRPADPSTEDGKAFEELNDFWEKNRSNISSADQVARRAEGFRQRFPKSPHLLSLEPILKWTQEARRRGRVAEIIETERQAQEESKRYEYGAAAKRVNAQLLRVTDDLESRNRLVMLRMGVLDKARVYSQAELRKARDLAEQGRRDDARRSFEALLFSLGDGTVEDFADLCKAARISLEALK